MKRLFLIILFLAVSAPSSYRVPHPVLAAPLLSSDPCPYSRPPAPSEVFSGTSPVGTQFVGPTYKVIITGSGPWDVCFALQSSSSNESCSNGVGTNSTTTYGGVTVYIGSASGDTYTAPTSTHNLVLTLGGADTITLPAGGAKEQVVYAGDGNDDITATGSAGSYRAYIFGGAGDDVVTGSAAEEDIFGGTGRDQIFAGGGVDYVWGGDGGVGMTPEILKGDAGDDYVVGGDGDDLIYGGTGTNYLFGDADDDDIQGDSGVDRACGGAGDDYIFGNANGDFLYGDGGDDYIDGDYYSVVTGGDDEIYLGDGDDAADGNDGDDEIYGGADDDYIDGGDDDDVIVGGAGSDEIYDGDGVDEIWAACDGGMDYLHGTAEGDADVWHHDDLGELPHDWLFDLGTEDSWDSECLDALLASPRLDSTQNFETMQSLEQTGGFVRVEAEDLSVPCGQTGNLVLRLKNFGLINTPAEVRARIVGADNLTCESTSGIECVVVGETISASMNINRTRPLSLDLSFTKEPGAQISVMNYCVEIDGSMDCYVCERIAGTNVYLCESSESHSWSLRPCISSNLWLPWLRHDE